MSVVWSRSVGTSPMRAVSVTTCLVSMVRVVEDEAIGAVDDPSTAELVQAATKRNDTSSNIGTADKQRLRTAIDLLITSIRI